jgi:hypothetical protein
MRVWITGIFGAKFENNLLLAILIVEKLNKLVGKISVSFLRLDKAGFRGYNDKIYNVAKVKTYFRVSHLWTNNDLTQYGSLAMN